MNSLPKSNHFQKKNLLLLFLLLFALQLKAQESDKFISNADIQSKVQDLFVLGDSILHGSTDSSRINSNNLFHHELENLLANQNTFAYSFDSLPSVSVLKSRNGSIKIYSWILPALNRSNYAYFGFVQLYDKKTKKVKLFNLTDKKYNNEEVLFKTLSAGEWYGALYYKLLETKGKGKTYYTLLGWQGNNNLTTRKVIDVLTITDDAPVFGAPIIKAGNKPQNRMVFEYTAQAVMKLNYDDRKKMIVFDNLSPARGAEKGQYEFYGPDFRYNALQFKKGNWIMLKDIDLRNPKSFDAPEGKKEKGKSLYNPESK